jgi:hypothetical protein
MTGMKSAEATWKRRKRRKKRKRVKRNLTWRKTQRTPNTIKANPSRPTGPILHHPSPAGLPRPRNGRSAPSRLVTSIKQPKTMCEGVLQNLCMIIRGPRHRQSLLKYCYRRYFKEETKVGNCPLALYFRCHVHLLNNIISFNYNYYFCG